MKMTPAWMAQTTEHLAGWGFRVQETSEPRELDGVVVFTRTRYLIERAPAEVLALEVLVYPDTTATYWLEILDWHGLTSTPYRLDSWRHREDRVELKFAIDPETGMGLSFTLLRDQLS